MVWPGRVGLRLSPTGTFNGGSTTFTQGAPNSANPTGSSNGGYIPISYPGMSDPSSATTASPPEARVRSRPAMGIAA